MGKIMASLPLENRKLIQYILTFLNDVSNKSNINKMTPKNMAVIFAPNMIRPKEDTIETALLSPQFCNVIEFFICNNNQEFWDLIHSFISKNDIFEFHSIHHFPQTIVETDSPLFKKNKKKNSKPSKWRNHDEKQPEKHEKQEKQESKTIKTINSSPTLPLTEIDHDNNHLNVNNSSNSVSEKKSKVPPSRSALVTPFSMNELVKARDQVTSPRSPRTGKSDHNGVKQ